MANGMAAEASGGIRTICLPIGEEEYCRIIEERASCTLLMSKGLVNRRGVILLGRRPSHDKPGKGGSQGWRWTTNYASELRTVAKELAAGFVGSEGLSAVGHEVRRDGGGDGGCRRCPGL